MHYIKDYTTSSKNTSKVDLGLGLTTSDSFPEYFSYDDLINWCESKKTIELQKYTLYDNSPFRSYDLPPNRNALIQFIVEFGRFFENKYYEMYNNELEKSNKMELPKIKW